MRREQVTVELCTSHADPMAGSGEVASIGGFTPFEKPGASRGVRAPGLPPVLGIGIGELEMKAKLGPRPDSSRYPKATISILWQGFKPRLPRSRGWTCQASYGRASFAPTSEFLRRVVQEDVC